MKKNEVWVIIVVSVVTSAVVFFLLAQFVGNPLLAPSDKIEAYDGPSSAGGGDGGGGSGNGNCGPISGYEQMNSIAKWRTNTCLMKSMLFDNGQNVGIGTANPQNTLHI